jgi:hypothetical protein
MRRKNLNDWIVMRIHNRLYWILLTAVLLSTSCVNQIAEPTSNSNSTAPPASVTKAITPKAEVGSIKVGSRPAGATVILISEEGGGAGRPQPRGTTPTVISDVTAGKYAVHLELRGYKPFQQSVEVKAGETVSVTAVLVRERN